VKSNVSKSVAFKLPHHLPNGRESPEFDTWTFKSFVDLMDQNHVDFKFIPMFYGGPRTLAKYRAFIDIPYQYSTMKLYENLAHGVVMLIPTIRFCKELSKVYIISVILSTWSNNIFLLAS
jgi:hypothetical protein